MFRKIVSSLPFNPGMLHQLSFYAKRLHQEEAVRRTGVIFTILALGVQTMAILSPAQVSLATSDNDIVYGATSKQEIINALNAGADSHGRNDIKQIYDYYGIRLADIQAAGSITVKSRERQYITTGRGDSPGVDTPIQIPGTGTTLYERSLNVWDIINYENIYPAITGTATGEGKLKGRQFWILLKGCGNITFENIPQNPRPEIVKNIVGNGTYRVGDIASFRIDFRNTGDAPITGPVITDTLAPEFEFVSQNAVGVRFEQNGQNLTWYLWPVTPTQTWSSILVKVRMKTIPEAKKQVCNAVLFSTQNAGNVSASNPESERCLTIDNTCPGSNLPAPNGDVSKCPKPEQPKDTPIPPTATCDYLKITDKPAWNKRTYEAKFSLSSTAKLNKVVLNIDNKVVKDFGSVSKTSVLTYTHTYSSGGSFSAATVATPNSPQDYSTGPGCEVTETITQPYTRISLKKGVSNLTQKIEDANNTTAKGGDVLEYSLSVSNSGNEDATNYIIDSDVINDILAYADLVSYDGASFNKTYNRLTWAATTIPAGGTVVKKFSVKVKDPVPTTPLSLSDPHLFDFSMVNTFGNQVVVNIDKPFVSTTYQTVTKIPNTGPGSSILISLLGIMVIGYFYSRSRLLAKEVAIIKADQVAGV